MKYDFEAIRMALNSPGGADLVRYLEDNASEMEHIESVDPRLEPFPLAIAFHAQKAAAKRLRAMLSTLLDIPEKGTLNSGSGDFAPGIDT
jgi:hypothetical protein